MPKVTVTNAKGLFQETGTSPASFAPGIGVGVQSLTAAGSDQTDTTPIVAANGGLVLVSGADGSTGVILPTLSSVPAGTLYYILNLDGSSALEVFPAVGDKIHPAADNAAITVAASGMLICVADSAGVLWASAEPAVTGA
jgi:hypothetical protein